MATILIILLVICALVIGYYLAWHKYSLEADKRVHTAVETQRSVLKGKISEQLAPFIEGGFPEGLLPSEAHFLGNPVDFIVFKGINDKKITEVVFVELKTGKAHLNGTEYSLRDTINNKNVRFISHTVPEIKESIIISNPVAPAA
jgi:predicted Holliday junction resolvase-like endonuclease